jgi:hypothetical protein
MSSAALAAASASLGCFGGFTLAGSSGHSVRAPTLAEAQKSGLPCKRWSIDAARAELWKSETLGRIPQVEHAKLGIIRLDYNYPTEVGDIDNPSSFLYPVKYRVVPGLTFQMCQEGKMTPEVEERFIKAVAYLDEQGCSMITGDCGFMLYFQGLVSKLTTKGVVMSSLCILPCVTNSWRRHGKIAIFTANSEMLEPMHDEIKRMCGVDPDEEKYLIVGCEEVPGFEPIFHGGKIDIAKATPGMVEKALQVCSDHEVQAFVFECTQLPPFSDAVRAATQKPVFDAITMCDFVMASSVEMPRFGLPDWHLPWDGKHSNFVLGDCLGPASKRDLVSIMRGNTRSSLPDMVSYMRGNTLSSLPES